LHKGKIAADGTPEELVKSRGHEAHVRVEAVVDGSAGRLLKAIRGVREVRELGKVGIHSAFEVLCDEDLREDVGALAGARGWSLRELSWRRPTLEQIFSRIALEGADEGVAKRDVVVAESSEGALKVLGEGPKKVVYNLNPFDMGAARDLGKPKAVEGPVLSAEEQRAREAGGGS
jgi:hypothetical protein